ncbi:10427_t:CDS:1 [Diversispora eburnea]|uniref:10427_t:CDS:1 n=1 Tax=Diversispora eburnea TaxID=1213867 RepID=A0A9N8YMH4_9GLOM|nr:10427_t:CDS:1 [Diversispora eburnea]
MSFASQIADAILSRDSYLAAYKSDFATFYHYREHLLTELLRLYQHRLFPSQLDALRERFEVSLQEVVNATPIDVEILERDYEHQPAITLEEQRDFVQRNHFEQAFSRLRESVQSVVRSTTKLSSHGSVSAHL